MMAKHSRLIPYIAAALFCLLIWDLLLGAAKPNVLSSPQFSPVRPKAVSGPRTGSRQPLQHALPEPETAAIEGLIFDGNFKHDTVVSAQTNTLENAAIAYRKRRGRHPPPGFDLWYEYASSHDAVIVEEFWDQIYEDLAPFWAVSPLQLREHTRKIERTIEVKSGRASATSDWFWHTIWAKMISEVSEFLPDLVIACNSMDEPRIMVPFADMSTMMDSAEQTRPDLLTLENTINTTKGWEMEKETLDTDIPEVTWRKAPPFSYARAACPPGSPIYQQSAHTSIMTDQIDQYDRFLPDPDRSHRHGLVTNTTEESNLCNDANITSYHAALTDPLTASTSTALLPMFGGSKFANVNNDILLPAAMYWNDEERFIEADETPWSEKSNDITWRGTATGGWNKPNTWTRFHRHRFVALTNGTKYEFQHPEPIEMFTTLWNSTAISSLAPSIQRNLPRWLNSIADIGLTDLFCDTHDDPDNIWGECWYTAPHYEVLLGRKMSFQYKSKYLPDIDGNSFSGRYRSFLLSNSLPIKATLYREWHDSRLVAWKHFVPMNNRFDDFFRIMQYFVGCSEQVCGKEGVIEGHDAEAEKIAREGREWAEKVLRKEDMQIYVFRLLLEWARITDDERLRLGWVDDLRAEQNDAS